MHLPATVRQRCQGGHGGVFVDFGATVARCLRVRECYSARVYVAVVRIEHCRQIVGRFYERVQPAGLGELDEIEGRAQVTGLGVLRAKEIELALVGREIETAGLMDAAGDSRFPLDLAIETDGVSL